LTARQHRDRLVQHGDRRRGAIEGAPVADGDVADHPDAALVAPPG
jgi:hypothetical protein